MVGTILEENSITVTLAPNLFQTDPSSSPMYPPPITAKFLGTSLKFKAPVELTIFSSSTTTFLIFEGIDPVAIKIVSDL